MVKNDNEAEKVGGYRQIMKATSIFGGVQVFNIIISIVRSKVIALLLGPTGMGIAGLFTSNTLFIGSLTSFGLGTSAVKDIAAANESGDKLKIAKVIEVLRRLVWFTGIFGAIFTFILAPWLSELSFGNSDYTIAFRWLSITLVFKQLTDGQSALLQGLRKLKYLAKANMFGSALGLLVSFPLYYYFNVKGIVPALILTLLITLIVNYYFSQKVHIQKVNVTLEETKVLGKEMMVMGFMLSLSGIMTLGASYVVRIFISNTGGIDDVGYFNAAFAIINTYVGLVFTAMSTDYYPRLAGVAHDNKKAGHIMNQQADIAILVLAPVLVVFIIFINWIVIILYSTKFAPIDSMLHWMAMGIFFKAASWSISFILLAKGASKVFFWNELIANVYGLGLNLLGYYLYGLEGLGISFLINYILYLVQVLGLAKYKYEFKFSPEFYKIFTIQFSSALISFSIIRFTPLPFSYFYGIPIILFSSWYSFKELDKRMDLRELLNKIFKKK